MSKPEDFPVEAFFTKEQSEQGVRVPLRLPNGQETPHWLEVLGTDSKAFKEGCVAVNQRFLKKAGEPQDEKAKLAEREQRNLLFLALLIKDWSFDRPCDEGNKVEVLSNAPALAEMIDRFANDRSNFFKMPSADS